MILSCPNCLNPFKVRKVPKGFIEAGTKCPKCEIKILRRNNPTWQWIKNGDYYLGTYNKQDLDISKQEHNLRSDPAEKIHNSMDIKEKLKVLSGRERGIVDSLNNGFKIIELAKRHKVSKQRIQQIIQKIRDKMSQ